jgi:hypothetical protein
MIERISRVPLRKIWKHEAKDFTVWLVQNIDILGETIGVELSNPENEKSTGNFKVDIRAEDESGDPVIIENQLGKSDHDHLGKLITYLSSFESKKAIWIVAEPRQEHINAINWLNEGGNDCNFYLLKIEGIKIGNSNPAPLITLIVGPSDESKEVGKIKKEDSERHKLRLKFWTLLLNQSSQKHDLFKSISPNKDPWIATTAGVSGIGYQYWVTKNAVRIELRIDRGKDREEENLFIFNQLKEYKTEIELKFGDSLHWDESEGNRMCAIRKQFENGGYRDNEENWNQIIGNAIRNMIKLEEATRDYLKKLKI